MPKNLGSGCWDSRFGRLQLPSGPGPLQWMLLVKHMQLQLGSRSPSAMCLWLATFPLSYSRSPARFTSRPRWTRKEQWRPFGGEALQFLVNSRSLRLILLPCVAMWQVVATASTCRLACCRLRCSCGPAWAACNYTGQAVGRGWHAEAFVPASE